MIRILSFLLSLIFIGAVYAEEWAGADELAEEKIAEIDPNYEPWFEPIFEPPSGEIETFFFSLQAAVGAFILGYYIGKKRG